MAPIYIKLDQCLDDVCGEARMHLSVRVQAFTTPFSKQIKQNLAMRDSDSVGAVYFFLLQFSSSCAPKVEPFPSRALNLQSIIYIASNIHFVCIQLFGSLILLHVGPAASR
jgi:hypothetical protein